MHITHSHSVTIGACHWPTALALANELALLLLDLWTIILVNLTGTLCSVFTSSILYCQGDSRPVQQDSSLYKLTDIMAGRYLLPLWCQPVHLVFVLISRTTLAGLFVVA